MKTIKLGIYGLEVFVAKNGSSSITSTLHERANLDGLADSVTVRKKKQKVQSYNSAMDSIEALILAHAVAGVDVKSDRYKEGIRSAVESCTNNLFGEKQ